MIRAITFVAFAIWLPLAQAADLDRGTRAFNNRDFNTARHELEPLAQAGDDSAQLLVGVMHASGRGYRRDLVQGYKWLTLSAQAGNSEAKDARSQVASRMTRSQIRQGDFHVAQFQPTRRVQSTSTSSWSQPPPAALPTGRALIAEVQAGLSRLGFDPGPADGLMGRRTGTAISSFQRQAGLRVDGKASQEVLAAIRRAESEGLRATSGPSTAQATATHSTGQWYFVRPDADRMLRSLRNLLKRDNDAVLRDGVRKIVRRNRWSWNELAFRDDFKKGAAQGGLDWRVVRGEYSIRDGLLSDSRAQRPTASTSSQVRSRNDQVADILGALLGAQINSQTPTQGDQVASQSGKPDEIHLASTTGDVFLLRARVLVQDLTKGMAFALQHTARGRAEEIRLRYGERRRSFIVDHVTSAGRREVAAVSAPLTVGQSYNIEWAGLGKGRMQVALNGQLIMASVRADALGEFDNFLWRNEGGSYLMSEVEMHTQR